MDRAELKQDYERAVAAGCFHGTLEDFEKFRKTACWGLSGVREEGFWGVPDESMNVTNGAIGPLGVNSGSDFTIVPRECKYCKVRSFPTIEKAEHFVSENPRITDVEIITECEFVNAWNNRFYK